MGIVLPHINIKLEDLAGNELKDKHVGIIKVKSKSNSNGYFEIKIRN